MRQLDETADIISYEEYHPFGTTSYRSGRTETETSQKRYKYVGKERDEETGLYYYGFRYYAAWLCRFVSVDPLQFDYPQLTPYNYAGNKPVTHIDGLQSSGDEKRNNAFYQNTTTTQDENGNIVGKTMIDVSLKQNEEGNYVLNYKKITGEIVDGNQIIIVDNLTETVSSYELLTDKAKEILTEFSEKLEESSSFLIKGQGYNFAETGFSKYNPRADYNKRVGSLKKALKEGSISQKNYAWARYQAQRSVRKKSSTYGKLIAEIAKSSKKQEEHAHQIASGLKEFPKGAGKTRKSINIIAKYAKPVARGLTVLSLGLSIYNIATAEDKGLAIAEEAGGWAGATAGSIAGVKIGTSVGAFFGGIGAPVGAIIGGIIGGALGYWGGSKAAGKTYKEINKNIEYAF